MLVKKQGILDIKNLIRHRFLAVFPKNQTLTMAIDWSKDVIIDLKQQIANKYFVDICWTDFEAISNHVFRIYATLKRDNEEQKIDVYIEMLELYSLVTPEDRSSIEHNEVPQEPDYDNLDCYYNVLCNLNSRIEYYLQHEVNLHTIADIIAFAMEDINNLRQDFKVYKAFSEQSEHVCMANIAVVHTSTKKFVTAIFKIDDRSCNTSFIKPELIQVGYYDGCLTPKIVDTATISVDNQDLKPDEPDPYSKEALLSMSVKQFLDLIELVEEIKEDFS